MIKSIFLNCWLESLETGEVSLMKPSKLNMDELSEEAKIFNFNTSIKYFGENTRFIHKVVIDSNIHFACVTKDYILSSDEERELQLKNYIKYGGTPCFDLSMFEY